MSEDRLCFFSRSRDVSPGKGAGELVNDISVYNNLKKIKDWRKVLSNFHVYPFTFEGHRYNTIEHVFQAKKIEIADKDMAFLFTLECGHEIGLGDGEIARRNRKLVKLNAEQLKAWNEIKDDVMFNAATEKYKACIEAQNILVATQTAQLWHIVPRSKPVRFIHLEKIRSSFD